MICPDCTRNADVLGALGLISEPGNLALPIVIDEWSEAGQQMARNLHGHERCRDRNVRATAMQPADCTCQHRPPP